MIADFCVAAIPENKNHERAGSWGKVSMEWQERFLSLSELKEDYFRGGKLTETLRLFLFIVSGKEKVAERGEVS